MYIFISILILAVSVLIGLIVLVQNPKGGGLATKLTGSGSQFMGVRQTADFLEKASWGLAIALLILSLTATMVIPRNYEVVGAEKSEIMDKVDGMNNAAPIDFQAPPPQEEVQPE